MMEETELGIETFKVSMEEELEKYPELTKEMIEELREWIASQFHLPQSIQDLLLVAQLVASGFHLENAKKALDKNYTIRTKAEFFKNRDPCSDEIEYACTQCYTLISVPDVDGKGTIGFMGRLVDPPDPAKYDFYINLRNAMMVMETALLDHGTAPGMIFIADICGVTLKHMLKAPFTGNKLQMQYMMEGIPWRITQMHFINTKGSIIDKMMFFIKPFINDKIMQQMNFHQGFETLYEHGLKASRLPEEYGGTAGTYAQIAERQLSDRRKYKEYFTQEETQRVDESKRERKKYFGIF